MMSKEQAIEKINQHAPKFISLLGGKLVDFDVDKDACRFEFDISSFITVELQPPRDDDDDDGSYVQDLSHFHFRQIGCS